MLTKMAPTSESSPIGDKVNDLEAVHTEKRVPEHHEYYEKDGLRTYGDDQDDQDHQKEPPVRFIPSSSQSSC